MAHRDKRAEDRALGMHESITRRDFLGGALLASGAFLLGDLSPAEMVGSDDDWTGYGGVGDYSGSNGNTREVLTAGHQVRDGAYNKLPADTIDTGETYDCVVVGGGISGLAAALFFRRLAGGDKTCLILENHAIFGGEAKRNEFLVDGHRLVAHQGSAIYFVPYPHSFIARFYDSIGLDAPKLTYQKWAGAAPEMALGRTPYDAAGMSRGQYGFYFGGRFGQKPGAWLIDPLGNKLDGAPVSAAQRAELYRWFSGTRKLGVTFEPPKYEGDPVSRRLDSITLEDHIIERFDITRETVRLFLCPVEGGGSGLGPDALSAYSDYAADLLHPWDDGSSESVQMFPGGNAEIARLMTKALIPDAIPGQQTIENICRGNVNFAALDRNGAPARIRLRATAVSVQHDGEPEKSSSVIVGYLSAGKVYRLRARTAIMAGGSWTTRHIIRDLPESHRAAYAQFYRSPCMMANIALRNWRFLAKMDVTGCRWFEGIGNYLEVRRLALCGTDSGTISPDSPVVLTMKVLYPSPGSPTEEQGRRGRMQLFSTSFRDYERQIREQFTDMFSRYGFHSQRDIAGIILNRWGHAYLSPQPGFFFGKDGQPAPRDLLRGAPFGRIAFANTDLAGAMDHRCSILEGHRAVSQLLDQVLTG